MRGGTIDESIGDAIFVLFGAPMVMPDAAQRAVRCALEMQKAMCGVNEHNFQMIWPEIEMGIGIHTGEVVVGNIGSAKRSKYGVVGRTVNLTARIESFTVGGQVLVSPGGVWAGSFHGRRNDFMAMGTPETGDAVWVWPGVDKLPKDIGQMGGRIFSSPH